MGQFRCSSCKPISSAWLKVEVILAAHISDCLVKGIANLLDTVGIQVICRRECGRGYWCGYYNFEIGSFDPGWIPPRYCGWEKCMWDEDDLW